VSRARRKGGPAGNLSLGQRSHIHAITRSTAEAYLGTMTTAIARAAPIRVAVVEDDEGIRASLAEILGRSEACRLVGSYANAESALTSLPRLAPEVVLMDINLPRMDGIECLGRLKEQMPATQFIMVTVYGDNERLFRSLMAGASGYLLKRSPFSKLVEAIREAHEGGSPMTPQIARRVVQYFRSLPKASPDLESLTPREKEILEALSEGMLYKEIVDHLGISLDTVRTYIRRIYEKLHVHSRTAAVMKYIKRPA
jgi:DNA-binding NarL/FixJ family response regulator